MVSVMEKELIGLLIALFSPIYFLLFKIGGRISRIETFCSMHFPNNFKDTEKNKAGFLTRYPNEEGGGQNGRGKIRRRRQEGI
jgi:hypothetical protein